MSACSFSWFFFGLSIPGFCVFSGFSLVAVLPIPRSAAGANGLCPATFLVRVLHWTGVPLPCSICRWRRGLGTLTLSLGGMGRRLRVRAGCGGGSGWRMRVRACSGSLGRWPLAGSRSDTNFFLYVSSYVCWAMGPADVSFVSAFYVRFLPCRGSPAWLRWSTRAPGPSRHFVEAVLVLYPGRIIARLARPDC